MSFQARLELARAHEISVREDLIRRGWETEQFGQALLSEPIREHLRTVRTWIRWMPDIIAAKNIAGRSQIIFVDAKAGKRYIETGNHDVETAALEAAEKWTDMHVDPCPYYFVFDNKTVATPGDIRENCWDGPFVGNGSGTPFKLFPCSATRAFDSVFGQPIKELAT